MRMRQTASWCNVCGYKRSGRYDHTRCVAPSMPVRPLPESLAPAPSAVRTRPAPQGTLPTWRVEVETNVGWRSLSVQAPSEGNALDTAIHALWSNDWMQFVIDTRRPVRA